MSKKTPTSSAEHPYRKLAYEILDGFEDVLDKHDIKIPDPWREGEEDEACIFGETYYGMEDGIVELVKAYFEEQSFTARIKRLFRWLSKSG